MKRKSGQHRPDKRKQARADDAEGGVIIREGICFTQIELAPSQSVILSGSAVLEVTSGCIAVFGALVTPEWGPVTLHAPSKLGKALLLTATTLEQPIPPAQPAGTTVKAVLHSASTNSNSNNSNKPASEQQGTAVAEPAAAAAAGGGGVSSSSRSQGGVDQGPQTYTVVDAAAPAASAGASSTWQVPAGWRQVAENLTATAAAAAAASYGSINQSTSTSTSTASPATPLITAVTGSKGSGKSAFARLLVNTLLSSGCGAVAYLDLDPGQPEFTPPGLLSLHVLRQPVFGPAHLQQQEPLCCFFQGDTSSQSEPGRYLQSAQALCNRYFNLPAAATNGNASAGAAAAAAAAAAGVSGVSVLPPLVINTPGWITGLGLELLAELLRFALPSHVVQMQTSNAKKNLPAGYWWLDGSTAAAAPAPALIQIASTSAAADVSAATVAGGVASGAAAALSGSCFSCQSGDTNTTAAGSSKGSSKGQLSAVASRHLMWLSWAQRVCGAGNPSCTADTSAKTPTTTGTMITPAAAGAGAGDASGAGDEFLVAAAGLAAVVPFQVALSDVHVELLHAEVAPSELAVALNGAVVGLAASSSSSRGSDAQPSSGQLSQSALLPRECLGLGVVRAVDAKQQLLYLLTDLSEEQLQGVDTLLVGKLELPDRLLECKAFASPYQGLFCLTSTATGAGQMKSRNNLLRSSQILR